MASTPDDPSHWLKEYMDAMKFEVTSMKTEENTHLGKEYLPGMRESYPGALGMRYLDALWVSLSQAMFLHSDYHICEAPDERMTIVAACDPASSKNGDFLS